MREAIALRDERGDRLLTLSASPNNPIITVDRQIHFRKRDKPNRDDIKPAFTRDRTKEDQSMTLEIVINQKDHALESRLALAARSFSQAASVPDLGGFAALRATRSRFCSS